MTWDNKISLFFVSFIQSFIHSILWRTIIKATSSASANQIDDDGHMRSMHDFLYENVNQTMDSPFYLHIFKLIIVSLH